MAVGRQRPQGFESLRLRHEGVPPRSRLHDDDFDEVVEGSEVVGVSCVERQVGSQCGRRDEQINRACSSWLAARTDHQREHPAVGACRVASAPSPWPNSLPARTRRLIRTNAAGGKTISSERSSTPRGVQPRGIGSHRILPRRGVEVRSEAFVVDRWCDPEHGDRRLRRDEAMSTQWQQFADGHAVSSDDEGLALVEVTHDLAALVAPLAHLAAPSRLARSIAASSTAASPRRSSAATGSRNAHTRMSRP